MEDAKKDFRRFDHEFLDGAFRFSLNNFNNLDGVRELKLVNKLMQTRLEDLANKLDPNVSGSLSHRIRLRQASSTSMTKSEVKEFYDDFYELWKPFLDDREWFAPDELSSYYRLANPTKEPSAYHDEISLFNLRERLACCLRLVSVRPSA